MKTASPPNAVAPRGFGKLLVANRGEIALRVMKTARRMGLATVAVHSDADANTPHVKFADEAVRIGGAPSSESYLNAAAILKAAKLTGADCLHPGFGFLSENPDFAQQVADAGLTFIGPRPAAIRAMGLKREAKALVGARGVPLVPGFDGGDQSTALLESKAMEIGLPVIFKPSAGGGGKGMKIARKKEDLREAIESGRREAQNAFGDPTLIIEKYLERPRHLEIQLLGDEHGNVVHLFERECSIQRRHQKVVEETPSVALNAETRAAMGLAAVQVARAIDYTNAGTVEFIMDRDGRFYFSEMNTRLQVEHRVTEQVVGLDLVEQQIRIARGEKLAFKQEDLKQKGHAVQVRLYAEDPANGFLPSVGTVFDFHVHEVGGLTVDSGIESGGEVSMHYDPMVAKLICWGEDRLDATSRMVRALEGLSVQGVRTNRGFLTRLLKHPDYLAGHLHTGFIEEKMSDALQDPSDPVRGKLNAIVATLADYAMRRAADDFMPSITSGYRNNRAMDQFAEFTNGSRVEYRALGAGKFLIEGGTWEVLSWDAPALTLVAPDGLRQRARVTKVQDKFFIHTRLGGGVLIEKPRFPAASDSSVKGGFMAPMPGKVVKVNVRDGESVKAGQVLLVLEAMKMEQATRSPTDGVVKKVMVREGDQVTAGQILVVMNE
ncbi:MAG: biotin/lipoyl-binding protein [Archangium sp.]|nr:biotin/lipoyl-binding protein [Archangium sp.]